MQYTTQVKKSRDPDLLLHESLELLVSRLGMSLIELSIFHGKGSVRPLRPATGRVQVKAVIYKSGVTGIDDCASVHRLILPRLELAFPGKDIYLEVSSPGINRIIKEGREFLNYIGRGVKCYCNDASDWTAGILRSVDEEKLLLEVEGKELVLPYENIIKARLDW